MAKVAFSKLGLSLKDNIIEKTYINNKGEEVTIEIKTYLPIEEKIVMISNIINLSSDDNGFYNPIRVHIFTMLEMVFAYTNLTFTDKQKSDLFKLYDLFIQNGLCADIIQIIGAEEYDSIVNNVKTTIKNIYDYKNSAFGILDAVATDYENLNLDFSKIQEKLNNPEEFSLIRDVMTNLG